MDYQTLWFILIAVLFTGYFVLEGFDFGVGILLPFLAKEDLSRRTIINTIGPHWDGNEVWLITAGGAMFAAFPHWYATLFSGFYLPLFLILIGLIFRGVAFEFRSKDEAQAWRSFWDWSIFFGSLIPAFLWGVAFANIVRGVPIDQNMMYTGGFWNLLSPYSILAGVASLLIFMLHGAMFLLLKIKGAIVEKIHQTATGLWMLVFMALVGLVIYTYFETDLIKPGTFTFFYSGLSLVSLFLAGWFNRIKKQGKSFVFTSLTIVFAMVTMFSGMFPRVMISSLNPEWTLTIFNSSSGPMTLKVLSIIALIFVPLVLLYQGWSYWIFRKRITSDPQHLEY